MKEVKLDKWMSVRCQDYDCILCKHCSHIVWDYTHGPYCLTCDLGRPEIDNLNEEGKHTCEKFEEDVNENT